jgi:hypothetical protein
VLALAAFTIILAWPETSPEAVKRASELGAAVLVVPAAARAPEAPQGLEVVAAVAADGKAVAAAKRAGFGGVMIGAPDDEGALKALLKEHGSFIRIVSLKREQAHRDVSPAVAAVRTGQWPGLMALNGEAAATEQPWINANLHHFAWLEGFYPKRMPALDYEPPQDSMQYEGAEIALAEAWTFGGAVVLRLPPAYREGLAKGDARAQSAWERLREVAAFLSRSGEGPKRPASSLAVLVPQWDEEFEEILNLAWRQQLSPRVIAAEGFAPARGLRMVAAPNQALPGQTQARLREFAAAGGIVMVTPEPGKPVEPWWGDAKPAGKEGGIETFRAGRGTVRVMEEPALDPFVFALDLREQLGMDNPSGRGLHGLDVRLWNASAVLPALRREKDGELTVVLIGYGRWTDHDFLAGTRGRFRAARLAQPASAAQPVKLMPRGERVEWDQPGLHRIAVITLEEAVR